MEPTLFKTDPSFDLDMHIIAILDHPSFLNMDRKKLERCLFLGYLSLEPYEQKVFSQVIEVYVAQKHLEDILLKTTHIWQKIWGKREKTIQFLQQKVYRRAAFLQKPGIVVQTIVLFEAFFKTHALDSASEEIGKRLVKVFESAYQELKNKNILI